LNETYSAARHARRDALDSPDPTVRHEWRKDIKRLAEQIRFLRRIWPAIMKPHARALADLGAALGHEHDLALLAKALRDDPDAYGPREAALAIAHLAGRAAAGSVDDARPLAARALAEKPPAFCDRIEALWHAWRE
jgi:hypothetical protein